MACKWWTLTAVSVGTLMLRALVSLAGAARALRLVREGQIEREPLEFKPGPDPEALPEPARRTRSSPAGSC
jgi:hypothetical protein